ncbi:MAG: hypothetical protein J6S75_03600, partial [Thermoguttaceae bacterium]|nr:hypothetical protein [Thermoguttaceae bacterium]
MTVRQTRKEGGVVLLLILGFMAMFAVMVVTFIMMTTNMSESANSNVTSGQMAGGAASGANPDADARGALRTLMIGTNDHASPIGPFSIGENLYGEVSSANNDPFVFNCNGFDYLNNKAWVTIDPSTAQLTFQLESTNPADNEALARSLVHETGSVLTFDMVRPGYHGYHSDFWNQHVKGTSALICDKSMAPYGTGFYSVSYTLLPSAELKQFMALFSAAELSDYNADLTQPLTLVGLRINPPAFSGTGAGGFAANTCFDGEIGVDSAYNANDTFRLPYALWGNASAPDKVVYNAAGVVNTRVLDARTFYKHLSDSAYTPLSPSGGDLYPMFHTGGSEFDPTWRTRWDLGTAGDVSGFFPAPIRMNPSYTAPDTKTPFLAHLGSAADGVPSFHRPSLLLELYNIMNESAADGVNENVDWQSVLRKLTPRPLPRDHWNFSGSKPTMSLLALCGGSLAGLCSDDAAVSRSAATTVVQNIAARLSAYGGAVGPDGPWDVDNDGDGTKESIWIPSGLPIRSASDGTPYATF